MNNPVSQILFSTGNAAILAAGSRPASLAIGQLGIFSYKTGTSIDSTSAVAEADEFYIAVGTDPQATGVLSDIRTSAGQYIQMKNVTALTYRCYSASQGEIHDITGFVANCNTEYAIRIGLQVEKAYVDFGYNLPTKTFTYVTSCCNDCGSGCPSGDCNELAFGLLTTINNDPDGLFIANFLDYTTTPGTPIVVADGGYTAWVADSANAGKCLGLRITSIATALGSYIAGINLNYDYPRVPVLIISLIEGFACNGAVALIQGAINEQGGVYDLLKEESDAFGNTASGHGPFRVSELLGMPFAKNVSIAGVAGSKYAQYIISGGSSSGNGGSLVTNMTGLQNTIAIPCADTTTRTSFVTAMDALTLGKFTPLIASNVACPACTVANIVSSQNDNTKIGDARG